MVAAAMCEPGALLVEVRTVSGTLCARLAALPEDTVGTIKQRALAHADPGVRQRFGGAHSILVRDFRILPDRSRLDEVLDKSGLVEFQLVCSGPSTLAAHLEALERNGREVVGLTDVADSVFQAEYKASMQGQPSADRVSHAMPRETRTQVLAWLGMACEATLIDDTLLHGAVCTLDRYAATCGERVDEVQLLKLSLASLCTEMKLSNAEDFPSGHWQRVLLHLGQGREHLRGVLEAEVIMLRQLNFSVGVPTPLTFLNGLSLRYFRAPQPDLLNDAEVAEPEGRAPPADLQLCLALARFLIELALYDVDLEYRYPPAVLAAGALGAALLTVGPHGIEAEHEVIDNDETAAEAFHDMLLDDLASYSPHLHSRAALVHNAERDLLTFWQECARGRSDLMLVCYRHLRERHSRSQRVTRLFLYRNALGSEALLGLTPEAGLHSFHALYSRTVPMEAWAA